jgi:hypothetical protein
VNGTETLGGLVTNRREHDLEQELPGLALEHDSRAGLRELCELVELELAEAAEAAAMAVGICAVAELVPFA